MRLSLEWLGEFVDLPDATDLVERLTFAGFEDVEVCRTGPDLSQLRVGHVLEHAKHPNADRLSVCRVECGDGEPATVVCGAPNVAAGQKIAFAPVGTTLPDGTELTQAKIRGVVSAGMICSQRELGLGDDHEGILVLDASSPVGVPLSDVLGAGARELEYAITPNRGDAACLLGLAREVRALFGGALRLPAVDPTESGAPASDAIAVEIEARDDCYRYAARIVRGVRVQPSPPWIAERLAASGIRSINNVVDATNLVLLEFGQPLHGFDASLVRGRVIRVRRANPGEKLVTLDGQNRALDSDDLVIADGERAIALAGVMGGANTEVHADTTEVLIESAHFSPTRVRRGARRHGLRTEASYRFERGVDRDGIERAADRAARLIAELGGGAVAPGAVVALGSQPPCTEQIRFSPDRANRLLGTDLTAAQMKDYLERVGIACDAPGADGFECRIPSHRNDLHLQQDLTEEVARIHGYQQIPVTVPVGLLQGVTLPPDWRAAEQARDALVACGLVEIQTPPFMNPDWLDGLRLDASDRRRRALRLANPINDEEPLLRTTLLPAVLRAVHQNRSRQVARVEVFEVGRLSLGSDGEGSWGPGLPDEILGLAAILAPGDERGLWEAKDAPPLFFRAKGIAKKLLNQLGYVASFPGEPGLPYLHPAVAARIEVDGEVVGAVGETHPDVTRAFELDVPSALVELDLSRLGALPTRAAQFQGVSRLPSVRRDLAVVVDRDQPAAELLEAVRKTGGSDLVSADLFDRYVGRGVPEGRVSLAFRLIFQRADRTLTDAEVTKATDRVVRMLGHRFNGELR